MISPYELSSINTSGISRCSSLSGRAIAFFCHREEVASASLQHPRANQFIDGVEYASPFGWFVACGLE